MFKGANRSTDLNQSDGFQDTQEAEFQKQLDFIVQKSEQIEEKKHAQAEERLETINDSAGGDSQSIK